MDVICCCCTDNPGPLQNWHGVQLTSVWAMLCGSKLLTVAVAEMLLCPTAVCPRCPQGMASSTAA